MIRGNDGDASKASVSSKLLEQQKCPSIVPIQVLPIETIPIQQEIAGSSALSSVTVEPSVESSTFTFQSLVSPDQSSETINDTADILVRRNLRESEHLTDLVSEQSRSGVSKIMASVPEKNLSIYDGSSLPHGVRTTDIQVHRSVQEAHHFHIPSSQSSKLKMEGGRGKYEEIGQHTQMSSQGDDTSNNSMLVRKSDSETVKLSNPCDASDSATEISKCERKTTPRTIHLNSRAVLENTSCLTTPSRTITTAAPQVVVNTNFKSFQDSDDFPYASAGMLKTNPVNSHAPRVKRIKLEQKPPANDVIANLRKLICDQKLGELNRTMENLKEHLTELFFLQNGGMMMDYFTWKRRPSPQLLLFLREHTADVAELPQCKEVSLTALGNTTAVPTQTVSGIVSLLPKGDGEGPITVSHVTTKSSQACAASTNVPADSQFLANTLAGSSISTRTSVPCSSNSASPPNNSSSTKAHRSSSAAVSPARLQTRQHSISAVYDSSIGSQEEIVERAKQEAYVVQRISDLRKEGLWSEKRLPKVQEPPRTKAHWDYLLEEMVWLATDFAQERKWKKAAAKKCARMCQKYHQEQKLREERAEKEAEQKLRRIASATAKEIKQFWSNVEKLVEYKQRSRLEEKRKKALDLQLNFIVDQTEKYSSWLTQGMNKSFFESTTTSLISSARNSRTSSPTQSSKENSEDDDFQPPVSDADDEETIAKEEQAVDEVAQKTEIELLQKESDIPLEDLLRSLPKEILDKPASPLSNKDDDSEMEVDEIPNAGEDDEFCISSNYSTCDDEATLEEQERIERGIDHVQEIDELQREGDIPIENLLEKYANMINEEEKKSVSSFAEEDDSEEELQVISDDGTDESHSDEEFPEEYENSEDEENQESVGLTSLMVSQGSDAHQDSKILNQDKGPTKEITDIAADAERFQPKGYTYLTAQVATKVPFLLKHQLREYQHIGLDWLVTMQERKLNGILADEMGLGKTIQTIALLAHLACEKAIWGPHLIVVPTSVMLNWEMEFKKWCPAFKILTYYGSQKERKLKRTGWTKPNAFHVCITSYKLVIQDHPSFRRKRWKYFILDEAQNIKNFKSQRWQLLLNFQSQWRLLLTGTPLQNNLMELWSLMHFLMPNVFQSHRDFKEWFANPLSGMIEGSHEYNENLIKRLHKVLRPFLLRRLKSEVEKQLPRKFEHVIMCRLSKRQRYLYDDFMSQTRTKETLASGNFMSVINVLMQLRKVCNHPNMFEARPTISPFQMEEICFWTGSLAIGARCYDPFKHVDLYSLNLLLADLELSLTAFAAHRIKRFQTPKKLIEEIDSAPEVPPKCPPGKIKLHVRTSSSVSQHVQGASGRASPLVSSHQTVTSLSPARAMGSVMNATVAHVAGTQMKAILTTSSTPATSTNTPPPQTQPLSGYTFQLVQQQPQGIPIAQLTPSQVVTSTPITVQIQQTQQGPRITVPAGQLAQIPAGFAQILQTSTGQHILLTSNPQAILQPVQTSTACSVSSNSVAATLSTSNAISHTVSTTAVAKSQTVPLNIVNKPIMRVAPMNVSSSLTTNTTSVNNKMVPVLSHKPINPVSHIEEIKDKKPPLLAHNTRSLFYLESIVRKRASQRKEKLRLLAKFNTRRCEACPIYGSDLIKALTIVSDLKPVKKTWQGMGYVHCLNATKLQAHPSCYWYQTDSLADIVNTPEKHLNKLRDILTRFVFCVPAVTAPKVTMHVSHPSPSWLLEKRQRDAFFQSSVSPLTAIYHRISNAMLTQFPDPRLIQYDCGKLQTLDLLLRKLKSESHKVLIFTQMTRMLDVLEQFLNYHGHIYLRLDGTTRVEQRQALMERFNADKRIFCFILSTRSGGIGVNLIGADTVIFYDSDWNPTMDAQAQDRCHRIGQTRDVHIYRLISRMTVEENILRKANQKRLLGEVAIEGGNFTTAFFRKQTIKDLFEVEFGEMRREELLRIKKEEPVIVKKEDGDAQDIDKITTAQLEHALAHAEEETDIQAAKTAKAEAAAELAEFDESIPYDGDNKMEEEPSKVEEELGMLMAQLTPVERYAMVFLESIQEPFSLEQLKQAEEEIEAQKKDWELGRLQALKEEEERRALLDDDDSLYTYSHEDSHNQVYISHNYQEQMPMWAPPTPPQDENDVYVDYSTCFLYEPSTMAESQLPPIFIKREHKRLRVDGINIARKQKVRKDDAVCMPRSLFDRPTAAVLKMRRDVKLQKIRGIIRPSLMSFKPPTVLNKTMVDMPQDQPEWLIHEDWALLQAIQTLLELPLNLLVLSPGHTPNWDMVAEVVNTTGRIYRSPKQCKSRYEAVIIPREEGKILYDSNPKKQKKSSKGLCRVKLTENNRPMRTSQLFAQDNNNTFTHLHHQRFETIKAIGYKRTPALKPLLLHSSTKPFKHPLLSADSINYEQPLTPIQVAAMRADRIARDKRNSQASMSDSQIISQRQQQQTSQVTITHPVASVNQQGIVGLQSAQQLQSVISVAASSLSNVTSANLGSLCTAQRNAPGLTMRNIGGGNSQTVVSLTAAQVQAATQRIAATNLAAAAATSVPTSIVAPTQTSLQTSKGLTMQQIQALRTHNLIKQQQQQRLQRMQAQQQAQHQQTATTTATVLAQNQTQKLMSTSTISATNAIHTAHAQQRGQLPKQIVKPTRTISDADIAQLVKLQQQKSVSGAQVAHMPVSNQGQVTTQILTPAQLQQMQQQQIAQSPAATLVKTVATPSVTIPMSAVSLNIPSVQQVAGKAQIPAQLGTVQIVQQASSNAHAAQKPLSTVTVQHIQQVIKQVPQQTLQQLQVSSAASTAVVSSVVSQSTATQQSLMTQQLIAKTPQTVATLAQSPILSTGNNQVQTTQVASLASGQTIQTRVIPVHQPIVAASISSPAAALKQAIQVVTAATTTHGQSQIPAVAQIRSQSRLTSSLANLESTARQASVFSQIPCTTTTSTMSTSTPVSTSTVKVSTSNIASPSQPITVAVRPPALLKASSLSTTTTGSSTISSALGSSPTVAANIHPTQINPLLLQQAKVQNPSQVRSSSYTMRLRNPPKQ